MGLPTDPPFDGLGRALAEAEALSRSALLDVLDRVVEAAAFADPERPWEVYEEVLVALDRYGLNPNRRPEGPGGSPENIPENARPRPRPPEPTP